MRKKKVAIFLNGQHGDIMEASCVLRYREQLWGEHELVWFLATENMDLLKYQDIELREFPRGFGYPEMVKVENDKLIALGKEPVWRDYQPLVDENNHLNLELKNQYHELVDIDLGYFPAPHQVPLHLRVNVEYSNVSKRVFGIQDHWEWHPVLKFSIDEGDKVIDFIESLPIEMTVAIESFAGSGQAPAMTDELVKRTLQICREQYGKCNFIFVSHKYLNGNESFPEWLLNEPNVYFAKEFTVRQCALIVGQADLFISVSSGISVASSCWGNIEVPFLQICGSEICSTRSISLSRYELVTTEYKPNHIAHQEFEARLISLIKETK